MNRYLLLITTVIHAIKAVEQLMPASAGKDKLDAALAIVEAIVGDITKEAPALVSVIATLVAGMRTTGVIATPAKPAAA